MRARFLKTLGTSIDRDHRQTRRLFSVWCLDVCFSFCLLLRSKIITRIYLPLCAILGLPIWYLKLQTVSNIFLKLENRDVLNIILNFSVDLYLRSSFRIGSKNAALTRRAAN